MSSNDNYRNMMAKAAAYCSRKETCESEIVSKLKTWDINETVILNILNELKASGYVDNSRYIRAFIHDRYRFNHWGRVKIAYELKQKKFEDHTIRNALDDVIDAGEYRAILKELLQLKYRNLKTKPPYLAKQALIRYALSKGFETDLSFEIAARIVVGDDD